MSGKRKDSQPTRATPSKEGEDSNTGDEDPGQGEKPPQVSWPAFPALGVQRMSPMNQAAPASQLGQLLVQNGSTTARPMSPGRSDLSRDDSNLGDDTSSIGAKEDLDEEDENDEDLEDNSGDPERLKAFNMFVRLFVDENLDRHVPISKQPKEKIQAIIDSCSRQFPEYSDRARKRIRTYLKSCRRTKRSREQAGLDTSNRPTPPHLTSVLAEQLLARACENEADNAKRMRMGMEPVSQPLPAGHGESPPPSSRPQDQLLTLLSNSHQPSSPGGGGGGNMGNNLGNNLATSPQSIFTTRQSSLLPNLSSGSGPQPVFGASPMGLLPGNGVGLLNSNANANANANTNANANMVNGEKKPPLLSHKLTGTEITAVRQLITGYRESAAFLLRSADELEHLLQIQPKL